MSNNAINNIVLTLDSNNFISSIEGKVGSLTPKIEVSLGLTPSPFAVLTFKSGAITELIVTETEATNYLEVSFNYPANTSLNLNIRVYDDTHSRMSWEKWPVEITYNSVVYSGNFFIGDSAIPTFLYPLITALNETIPTGTVLALNRNMLDIPLLIAQRTFSNPVSVTNPPNPPFTLPRVNISKGEYWCNCISAATAICYGGVAGGIALLANTWYRAYKEGITER